MILLALRALILDLLLEIMGARLGCGAHLSGLIRTSQEKFMLSDACSLEDINLEDLISLEKAFEDLDFIKLNEKDSKAFIHGQIN